jgi:cytoplasmic iron level regulating protein YaaA (DUF328/UPF0246 family)
MALRIRLVAMLAVLSPAKSLCLDPVDADLSCTQPVFMKDATSLMRTARGLTQKRIRELMSLSAELAKLNYDRYRGFELPFDDDNALPAALMFDGEVYRGLNARALPPEELAWAQEHIGILSGMFGLLRPLDLVQPYRLEMGTRLKTRRGGNLYAFWGDKIRKQLDRQLSEHEDPTLVNLASNEYFKAVRARDLSSPVLECVFHDYKDAARTPNVISFMAKRARGLMARFIIEQRIDRVDGLRDFDLERYRFRRDLSTDTRWVFGRKFVPVAA